MTRVYGIEISKVHGKDITNLSAVDKQKLVDKYWNDGEVYTLEGFFNYLNTDSIDTENYFWIVIE